MRRRYTKNIASGLFITLVVIGGVLITQIQWVQGALTNTAGVLFATREGMREDLLTARDVLTMSRFELTQENTRLREELRQTRVELFDRNILKKENRELKALLGRIDDTDYTLASVLARPDIVPYDTLLIDVGTDHDIATGDRVFVGGTIFIGFVEEVFSNTSRVKLISSPGFETDLVLRTSDVALRTEGIGGGTLQVELPRDVLVREGEEVVVPGDVSYVAGIVSTQDIEGGDTTQTLLIRVPINMHTLKWVHIDT